MAARSDELATLADAFGALPPSTSDDRASIRRRHRDKEVLRHLLDRLLREEPDVAAAVDGVVAAINADADRLDALLERQNYRLAFWRVAERDLGYRRFFNVTSLAGLRVEDELVFNETHQLVVELVRDGSRGRAARRSPGRPARPGAVPGAVARGRPGVVGGGGEDPPGGRAPAAVARGRHHRLRLPPARQTASSWTRPGKRP